MAKLTKSLERPKVGRVPAIGKGAFQQPGRPSPISSRRFTRSRRALYPKSDVKRHKWVWCVSGAHRLSAPYSIIFGEVVSERNSHRK